MQKERNRSRALDSRGTLDPTFALGTHKLVPLVFGDSFSFMLKSFSRFVDIVCVVALTNFGLKVLVIFTTRYYD